MEKIKLGFTQDELDFIFDCLCGPYFLPKVYDDLINYVVQYTRGKGVYCSNK